MPRIENISNRSHQRSRRTAVVWVILNLTLLLGACSEEEQPLYLGDLSTGERTYLERLIILERAKAVALNDRQTGDALLDSLNLAWGDSVISETSNMVPTDPRRSRLVHELLMRVLEAERDSLMEAPFPRRLTEPLPDPPPSEPEAEA